VTGRRIEIHGTVQGVGFRPWVYRIAHEIGVAGRVRNDPSGVIVEAFGDEDALDALIARLQTAAPPPARVRDLSAIAIPEEPVTGFVIERSDVEGRRALSIPPDLATCPDCEREIRDAADRRFRYPFTNCTRCGPRFTIATGVPYDRPATTMARFRMCPKCQHEYDDPDDRRFHAQPNACPVCGPQLALWSASGEPIPVDDPLVAAAAVLLAGDIVAVKGLGGFHLACDATSDSAIARLRARKRRDEKPFAVMAADLAGAGKLAVIGPADEALLTSPERPIVLVPRRDGCPLSRGVAPDTELLGLLLPYTPLHHLLLRAIGRPLVMTSANVSEEPICADNAEAVTRLGAIADALLVHDRDIATRCDDSVARVIAGAPTVLRRSRGWVPRPIALATPVARPVLACGAHLKNTCCLADDGVAYLGPHVGDLETLAALSFFESAIVRMERILSVKPEVIAHDLHPGYLSTRYALARPEPLKVAVQHHHAHVAAAMAEHGLDGPVLGVAYDGTGRGTDGTSWGGELLLARADGFDRLATFRPIPLAGGDSAIRQVWRIGLALIDDAFDGAPPIDALPLFRGIAERDLRVVRAMVRAGVNVPSARGVGRYFDGVGALVLGRPVARHEGQIAVAWNEVAAPDEDAAYPFDVAGDDLRVIDLRPLVRAVVADVLAGAPPARISARFHNALVAATTQVVREAVAQVGRLPVVLTGGVFQNPRLAEGVLGELADLDVYAHHDVPPGDGGIALGQVVVADAVARGHG